MMRRRTGIKFATLLLLLGCLAVPVSAQGPIDPLTRPADEKGKLQYRLGWHTQPGVVGPSSSGNASSLGSQYIVTVHGGVQYSMARRLDLSVEGQLEGPWRREASPSTPASRWVLGETTATGSVGLAWRAAPDHPWAPVVSVERTVDRFGQFTVGVLGQRIADPLVVSGGLMIHRWAGGRTIGQGGRHGLAFALSTGLAVVFNDDYSGSAHVVHRLPIDGQPGAVTSLSFGLHRSIGRDGSVIDYEMALTERWNSVSVRFGMTWRGWGFGFPTTLAPSGDG